MQALIAFKITKRHSLHINVSTPKKKKPTTKRIIKNNQPKNNATIIICTYITSEWYPTELCHTSTTFFVLVLFKFVHCAWYPVFVFASPLYPPPGPLSPVGVHRGKRGCRKRLFAKSGASPSTFCSRRLVSCDDWGHILFGWQGTVFFCFVPTFSFFSFLSVCLFS